MRYNRFVIRNYRAITGPLEIDVQKTALTPVVGINESGKTTILHAVFAFDYYNDDLNDDGRHLKDTSNLYRTSSPPPVIEAEIEMTRSELNAAILQCELHHAALKPELVALKKRRALPNVMTIRRNLHTLKYSWDFQRIGSPEVQDELARSVILNLPFILFFDDFRDKIVERIEIVAAKRGNVTGWLSIVEQLFKQTDKAFSVFDLPDLEERKRKTVLAKVQRHLNETLTKEWQTFRLDDRDPLRISIDFDQAVSVHDPAISEGKAVPLASAANMLGVLAPSPQFRPATPQAPKPNAPVAITRNYVTFHVVETDSAGDEHFFFISDRSKGFYWFFNFVMKLEFNPKVVADDAHTVYLLDEPGSYLHAFAQRKLCHKLRQLSERNRVIYCTHSHYLLDPDIIPVSSIAVADKDGDGNVSLVPITQYHGATSVTRSALQPVLDALQIRPFVYDLTATHATVITEGIYDYFAIELFRNNRSISVLPSVGADSIKFYISLLIAWQVEFRALWDNDGEGREKYAQACDLFGSGIAGRGLRLLPMAAGQPRRIMQDLFHGNDLVHVRTELGLTRDCSFKRTLHSLFYSPRRAELVQTMSQTTKQNFEQLFESLNLG